MVMPPEWIVAIVVMPGPPLDLRDSSINKELIER